MKKILILEDNLMMLEYLSGLVGDLEIKCEVFPFTNVKDAYQCALEHVVDLFVVDIILDTSRPGDSSGLRFVDNIRQIKHYGFIPILFVTSLEDARLYTYEKLHCYSFIEKPFEPDRFRSLVGQCLSFPGGEREKRTFYFRKDGIIFAVDREDMVYAESVSHIMIIHTSRGDTLDIPYITVRKLLEEFDCPDIIQCSRSTIINKSFVHNVDIPNRIIQFKDGLGRVEIGTMYKRRMKEVFT